MKLALVRHTSLQVAPGVCYGQADVDVAATFLDEALITKYKLRHWQFDAVFSSPMQRCAKLAHMLTEHPIVHDARLKELHFGDWEMQAWDDLPRDYFDQWAQNYVDMAPPNGETFSQLQQRGVAFLQEVQAIYPQGHMLVITHGGMIRAMLAHVLNMPLKGLFRIGVDYGSVTQLDLTGEIPRVDFINR